MTKLETNRKCHLPTWQLAGHVVPSFEKFLASFLCLKAVTQHNFLEIFGKFAEELREIIERNLWALRAKLLPKQGNSRCSYFLADSLPRGKSDFDAVTFTAEALHPLSSITVASRKLPK